ncbi:hypothetical protein LU276_08185 [Moraxella haemolytica]|uniref:hypothetical protein n=1 Tax=Moraxella haemolytica TaxID=2904119 RepID=UPI002542F223|nr:hypothetical protein [Moraxella sp. ZY171148]WII94978.1 hypothetical protein LU276_08185 [Moraxella sp. ZY171148]
MSINKTLVMQILTVLSEQAPKRVSVERLGLCDEQDMELSRFAERIKGCETRELALANGVEVPRCDTAQDFLAWRASRGKQA